MAKPGGPAPTFFQAYGEWMQTAPPSWADVAWLRAQWEGPFMVKGVCRVDDARRVVDAGASALSVSNHGGNNLDGTPAPIRALRGCGRRRGRPGRGRCSTAASAEAGDVAKALALGARAVMIGRASLWGLAANGQAGVENVLDVLRAGLDATMRALGRSRVDELCRGDVVVPPDFFRVFGS